MLKDAQEHQIHSSNTAVQCLTLFVTSRVTMALQALDQKKEDAGKMELGVDKSSFVKVREKLL